MLRRHLVEQRDRRQHVWALVLGFDDGLKGRRLGTIAGNGLGSCRRERWFCGSGGPDWCWLWPVRGNVFPCREEVTRRFGGFAYATLGIQLGLAFRLLGGLRCFALLAALFLGGFLCGPRGGLLVCDALLLCLALGFRRGARGLGGGERLVLGGLV